MKKRRVIAGCSIAALTTCGLWLLFGRFTPEPVYQGKRLTSWLPALDYVNQGRPDLSPRDARRAVREAGTNAIPTLLRKLQATDSPLKKRLLALAKRQHLVDFHFNTAESTRRPAIVAFSLLGPRAIPAVPELVKLYDQNPPPEIQAGIAQVLGELGSASIPAAASLRRGTKSTNYNLSISASNALATIFPAPNQYDPVDDFVLKRLGEFDSHQQAEAIWQLDESFVRPERVVARAVPVLVQLLQSARSNSYWIKFGLELFDPDTAAKVLTNVPDHSAFSPDPAIPGSAALGGSRILAVGGWSDFITDNNQRHRLRGRLLVYEPIHYRNASGECWGDAPVEIELQDGSTAMETAPTTIYFDATNSLRLVMQNALNKSIPSNAYTGELRTQSQWITVPFDGTVRFRVDSCAPVSHVKPDGLTIRVGRSEWRIAPGGTDYRFLAAMLVISPNSPQPLDYPVWNGTLKLPPVKIPQPKP